MAREISDFELWIKDVENAVAMLSFSSALAEISRLAKTKFGLHLWFVEMLGRRWSYVAGEMAREPSKEVHFCIPLGSGMGMMATNVSCLSKAECGCLIDFLEQFVARKR